MVKIATVAASTPQRFERFHLPRTQLLSLSRFPWRAFLSVLAGIFALAAGVTLLLLRTTPARTPAWAIAAIVGTTITGIVALLLWVMVLERQRTAAELAMRARQQEIVTELGQRALADDDLTQFLPRLAKIVAEVSGADLVGIFELCAESGQFVARFDAGPRAGNLAEKRLTCSEPLAIRHTIIDRLSADTRFGRDSILHERSIVSGLIVPIAGHDRPFGVIGIFFSAYRTFSRSDAQFLQGVANTIGSAIARRRSEMQQRERDLLLAEQMKGVAQVAAGVAHELRNPLTSIKMLIQGGMEDMDGGGLGVDDQRIIVGEIRRMERCLQTFLDFARPPKPERRRFEVIEAVERVFSLIQGRATRQKVSLHLDRPEGSLTVNADPEQIQQLLLNLALNALDAMPGGGRLTAEVGMGADRSVEIRMADTGSGIAAELLPRLFEAFVTGKATGVGLGLVVSRRIAENHGGTLTARNLEGGGASFTLRLPADAQA